MITLKHRRRTGRCHDAGINSSFVALLMLADEQAARSKRLLGIPAELDTFQGCPEQQRPEPHHQGKAAEAQIHPQRQPHRASNRPQARASLFKI